MGVDLNTGYDCFNIILILISLLFYACILLINDYPGNSGSVIADREVFGVNMKALLTSQKIDKYRISQDI
jgi:hypothetical protein